MPVNWTAENDRKLLLNMITSLSSKDVDTEALALLFPGATAKAIHERISKLRREIKAVAGPTPPAPAATAPKRGRRGKAGIEAATAAAHGDAESGADLSADPANAAPADDGKATAPAKRGGVKAGKNLQSTVDEGVEEERGRKRKREFEVGGGGEAGKGLSGEETVEAPTKRGRGRPKGGKGVVVKKEVGNGDDEGEEGVLVDEEMAGADE